jgi:hypothetical protein
MSHASRLGGITELGKNAYSTWAVVNLPVWSSTFTQENDGSEAAEPIRC